MKRVFRKRNAQTLPHIDRHIARIDVHRRSIISGRYDRTVFQNTFYGRIGREDQPHRLLIIAVDDHQERATVVFQQRNHGSQPFRFENVDRFGQLGQPLRTARNRFAGIINGDVLCLNRAAARISVGERSGLRVPAAAVHYLKEDGTEAQTQGENYIPGVYVKLGNIARFCPIDPVDADHPLITDGDYILVLPEGTEGSVSKVRLYDEIIVSGQNLYDGKLL